MEERVRGVLEACFAQSHDQSETIGQLELDFFPYVRSVLFQAPLHDNCFMDRRMTALH